MALTGKASIPVGQTISSVIDKGDFPLTSFFIENINNKGIIEVQGSRDGVNFYPVFFAFPNGTKLTQIKLTFATDPNILKFLVSIEVSILWSIKYIRFVSDKVIVGPTPCSIYCY